MSATITIRLVGDKRELECSEHPNFTGAYEYMEAAKLAARKHLNIYHDRIGTIEVTEKRRRDEITAEIKELQDRINKLVEERDRVPAEPARGSVITFQVQFDRSGPRYRYAAIRHAYGWNTTAAKPAHKELNWEQLVALMRKTVDGNPGYRRLDVIDHIVEV